MVVLTPNQKGAIVEAAVAYEAIKAGVEVFKPLSEHARADLIFGIGSELYRVQCKSAAKAGNVLRIMLQGCRHTPGGYVRSSYSLDEIDLIAAHCLDLGVSYLLPLDLAAEKRSGLHLRLSPARNGQQAAIHFAADYELPGAVAQLEERRTGSAKATGSSPVSSTSRVADLESVGAHSFRDRFGHWLERASEGDEILITRRGRPYAKLGPAQIQDELTAD